MNRYCLAIDLKDDPQLIAEYEKYHEAIWPEIHKSIVESGITHMEIWRCFNRMFMIMETDNSFTFDKKGAMDAGNPTVQEWENLMWKYQQAIPGSKLGEKWVLMNKIFEI